MCSHKNRYTIVGIISSGKGLVKLFGTSLFYPCDLYRCGSYPGLYTDVARYVDWITSMIALLEDEIE